MVLRYPSCCRIPDPSRSTPRRLEQSSAASLSSRTSTEMRPGDRTARLTARRCNALLTSSRPPAYEARPRLYRAVATCPSRNYLPRSRWRRGDAGRNDSGLRLLVLTQHLVRVRVGVRVRIRVRVRVRVSGLVRIRSTSTAESLSDCTWLGEGCRVRALGLGL